MAEQESGIGISVRNLYKIFGANPDAYIDAVKGGMTKAELNEKHNHVLGLKDINIDMPGGGIQVVMGLSGSGKSTLIRHINRLIDPTAGEVIVGNDDVVKMNEVELREFRRHKTAMVFQKFALLPHRTVLENTVYGLEINQLSGGMQQRVGLARALTNDAPILLMDEAFSALDPLIRMDMQSVLLDLQKEIRKTVVFITHDLDEALRLGDRIAILRDGEVVQQGTKQEIVLRPADEYISSFVREVNRGRVISVDMVMSPLSGDPQGMPVKLGTVLEVAAKKMTDSNVSMAHVTDADGKPVGALDIHEVISAMVTPVDHETAA